MSTHSAPAQIATGSPRVRFRLWLAALVAMGLALALFAIVATGTDPAVERQSFVDDVTRAEVIQRVERINGFTGSAAAGSLGTDAVGPQHEPTRAEVLEHLYRINHVVPAEPAVPGSLR